MTFPKRSRTRFRALAAGLALVAAFSSAAVAAPSAQQVQNAKNRLDQLNNQISAAYRHLHDVQAKANEVANELYVAQNELDRATAKYLTTKDQLDAATEKFDAISAQLDERTRSAFIEGSGSNLEFILGSTSFADLSDRVEYMSALARNDADLAAQVESLRIELASAAAAEQKLRDQKLAAVADVQEKNAQVQGNLQEQQGIVSEINREKAQAAKIYKSLKKRYQQSIVPPAPPPSGPPPPGYNGVFQHCPVGDPKAQTDSFGAPRYAGGFHLHMGNDIMAPSGVPIYAPFNGVARQDPNTLGGLAVIVTGSAGWVYNAHLSAYSSNSSGSVQAGDVIGYVGNSGDAVGGPTHDHFEFHPSVMPSSWPKSPYGYAVIGDAINPYPLLIAAC
ncbi:MAG: peptidoglycan DD-metalloendopeptidase family protein [Actinomycetota bacterium]